MAQLSRNQELEQPEQPRVEGENLIPPDPEPERTERRKLPKAKWY